MILNEASEQKMLNPSRLLKPAFLMNPPFSFSIEIPINSYMVAIPANERHINMELALQQWLTLYSYVSNRAIVYLLPAKEGLQDQTFVANLGVVMPHLPDLVVISNFRKATRAGETLFGVEFFKMMGYETIVAPQFFEGQAELRFVRDRLYFGGYGERTTINALKWFQNTYDIEVIPIRTPDGYMYHLDCFMVPITPEVAMMDVHKIEPATLKLIEKHVHVEHVGDIESNRGLETVRLGKSLLTHNSLTHLQKTDPQYDIEKRRLATMETIAAKYGFEVVTFDLSEFEKSGAGLGCLMMNLNYVNFTI